MCMHGGKVQIIPRQTKVMIGGAPAIRETDLMGAPIVGCPVPPTPATKPCTMVASTMPGGSTMKSTAVGMPIHTQTVQGLTDGVPPGSLIVTSPGQQKVQGS